MSGGTGRDIRAERARRQSVRTHRSVERFRCESVSCRSSSIKIVHAVSRANQQDLVSIHAECSRDLRVVFALRVKLINHVSASKNKITYAAVCHDASLLAENKRSPGTERTPRREDPAAPETVSTPVGLRRTTWGAAQQVYSV